MIVRFHAHSMFLKVQAMAALVQMRRSVQSLELLLERTLSMEMST